MMIPTAQGNQGKKVAVRENTGNLEILLKYREFSFSQVVNSLILKVKDIAIFFLEARYVCQVSFV